jgi:hypothetical protein
MADPSVIAAFTRQFQFLSPQQQQLPPIVDVCLGCTLPPAAVISNARSFDGVLDVAERFRAIREQIQRGTLIAHATGGARRNSTSVDNDSTFITCLLHVMEPMSRLMAPEDMRRLQTRFVEKERASIVQCAHSVALEYHAGVGLGRQKAENAPTVDAVRDSIIRDPVRAFTDDGLNHAVVYYLTRRMDVAVVMRPGPPGTDCLTFIPRKVTNSEYASVPCVLIACSTSDSIYRIEHEGPTMADVWAHLRSQPEVKACFERMTTSCCDRLTIPAIHALAAKVGMAIGGSDPRATASAFGGKAALFQAVFSLRS